MAGILPLISSVTLVSLVMRTRGLWRHVQQEQAGDAGSPRLHIQGHGEGQAPGTLWLSLKE